MRGGPHPIIVEQAGSPPKYSENGPTVQSLRLFDPWRVKNLLPHLAQGPGTALAQETAKQPEVLQPKRAAKLIGTGTWHVEISRVIEKQLLSAPLLKALLLVV